MIDERNTVEDVARTFLEALMQPDYGQAVDCICRDFIATEVQGWRNRLRRVETDVSPEEYLANDPKMPRDVAEYLAEKETRLLQDANEWWRQELPGTENAEKLYATPERELVQRYLRHVRALHAGERWSVEWRVMGAVLADAELAYAVIQAEGGRHREADGKVREFRGVPRLLDLRRSGTSWCVSNTHALRIGGGGWFLVGEAS
jgi:hypothetical protein